MLDPSRFRNERGGPIPVGVQLPAKREEVFRAVADHLNLQSVMVQLLGGPVKRFTDQALIKSSCISGESFYHQDSHYWHLKPELGCNAWLALDEVDWGAIALAIMPGKHRRWTLDSHEEYFDEPTFHNAHTGNAFKRYRIPLGCIDFSHEVVLPMSPGDAAFFPHYTWHCAEPNRSGVDQYASAIAYQLVDREKGFLSCCISSSNARMTSSSMASSLNP